MAFHEGVHLLVILEKDLQLSQAVFLLTESSFLLDASLADIGVQVLVEVRIMRRESEAAIG